VNPAKPAVRLGRWARRVAAALAAACTLLTFLIYATPLTYVWGRWLSEPAFWQPPQGEVLLVLGGAGLEDGTLGINSYWRSVYAARVWHAHRFRRILISGGPAARPVAASMRDLLVSLKVPAEVIEIEPQAISTRENAARLGALVAGDPGPFLLLTSDYHMYRARRVFARAGIGVKCHAIPDALKRNNFWQERGAIAYELAAETGKILYYRYQRWID